jgi:hypothetical protein
MIPTMQFPAHESSSPEVLESVDYTPRQSKRVEECLVRLRGPGASALQIAQIRRCKSEIRVDVTGIIHSRDCWINVGDREYRALIEALVPTHKALEAEVPKTISLVDASASSAEDSVYFVFKRFPPSSTNSRVWALYQGCTSASCRNSLPCIGKVTALAMIHLFERWTDTQWNSNRAETSSSSSTWECAGCTFVNGQSSSRCTMCDCVAPRFWRPATTTNPAATRSDNSISDADKSWDIIPYTEPLLGKKTALDIKTSSIPKTSKSPANASDPTKSSSATDTKTSSATDTKTSQPARSSDRFASARSIMNISPPVPWSCKKCTFKNAGMTTLCEMCSTPAPRFTEPLLDLSLRQPKSCANPHCKPGLPCKECARAAPVTPEMAAVLEAAMSRQISCRYCRHTCDAQLMGPHLETCANYIMVRAGISEPSGFDIPPTPTEKFTFGDSKGETKSSCQAQSLSGWTCPQCTLINSKDAWKCQVCGLFYEEGDVRPVYGPEPAPKPLQPNPPSALSAPSASSRMEIPNDAAPLFCDLPAPLNAAYVPHKL